jgi:PAS domain S-box-containing protein
MRHATIGGQERLLVTTNDITLRQQGEIALEDSERRYRMLFDSAGDAIFIHDTEARMLAVNATACERLGYTEDEILAMTVDAVDASEQGAQVPERMARLVAQGRVAFETVHRRKDGSPVPTEVNAQLITWKGRPAVMSVARDITERQRMEEALVRSSRTQSILNDVFRLSIENLDLTTLLQRTLDQVLAIPWLELSPKGAIFLGEGRTLRLTAHRRLAKPLLRACASVDFGRCLCGRAALTGEFVFVDHLDECHEITYEGMSPHGHYCVPILSAGEVMGVICLYLRPGHGAQPGEREVLEAVASALAGILRRKRAEEALLESAVALRRTVDGAVAAMGALVETRDPYTAGHERRVMELAVALGAEMGLGADTLETLRLASAVHDIGKVAVPAEILTKPGRLSETEFALIKVHPAAGADILASVEFGAPVADIVRWHHERLDGSGYPDGLVGEAIPREVRIIAVADVVEAMASHRPYRPALGIEAALAEIAEGAGRLYDADVAAACARVFAAGFAFSE